ncbi:MAG: M67 family metallopeptidase [Thiotrichales bacterium]|nr:MAG: M67 family metallopeptidase [Thiotrichales bacterium]
MNSELVLPRKLVNQILTHAQQHEHTESCGLISASAGTPAHYYAVKNIASDPATHFEMEPKQQIAAMKHMREHEEDLLAIVHSHPSSPPVPSLTDLKQSAYPDAYYIIVSLNTKGVLEMRGYKINDEAIQSVELHYEHED